MLGRNVPQIVEIEKLRSLPETSFGRTLADFLDSHHLCNHYWGSWLWAMCKPCLAFN
ncbi:hypothetical protein H6F74_25400 [Trichocoleus sp. FACHB-90]|uniref:hypothetical protein n=1 Tax=Cyanophyceae TaxID=3028117 RepID=UPI001685F719|nr:hypothetical protein [Trichocoleus sp. FACHB-90]MBD1929549.1 hypothetical protein [Trichocoleus sp. FACHB-90]